jgi:pimeloyl-ACP methyl ester carboxylesterase
MTNSALDVLGKDFTFPQALSDFPSKLSEFADLCIGHFTTSDGVRLAYWAAGAGEPLVFIPGWSGNGAQYVNLLYALKRHYRVYVLDVRNQGLSQRVDYGNRIARYAVDLRDFGDHLRLQKANYCGWSMGAAVLWSYVDLFGTGSIRKAAFVDEPISIYAHSNWSEEERRNAGGMTTSVERMVAAFTEGAPTNNLIVDMKAIERYSQMDSPYFINSESFANEFVKNDPKALSRVLFDHAMNDWRDVIKHKMNIPVAIFSGEQSNNLPSQRWAKSVIPGAKLYNYSDAEHGDHFLMFKNPNKFSADLRAFLDE